jgi:hypothetical protein
VTTERDLHVVARPPRLVDVSEKVALELYGGLREEGERDLSHSVFDLRVWGMCDCGRCGSFRTRPRLRGDRPKSTAPLAERRTATSILLSVLPRWTLVDVTIAEPREIVYVEIIDRPDVADELHRGLVAARCRR